MSLICAVMCHQRGAGPDQSKSSEAAASHNRNSLRASLWATTRTFDEIDQLGELRLGDHSMNPYHNKMKEIVTSFAKTEYTVILLGLFLSHTNHDVPLEIWKRGMLVLKPVDGQSSATFERIRAIFHRVDTHGEFDMTDRRRREFTII